MGRDCLIASSQGHFDAVEYGRQLEKGIYPESRSNLATAGVVREEVIQVVERYIDAVRRNAASAASSASGCCLRVPHEHVSRRTSFKQGLGEFARIMKDIEVIRLIVDGAHCVALVNIDTVFGPIPFAEHIHVVNGEIVSIRGYCDPRPMLSATNASD